MPHSRLNGKPRNTVRDVAQDWVFKDVVLDRLASVANVAQFVSFNPDLHQRFSRVRGFPSNHYFGSYQEGIRTLLANCSDGTVNIRSFDPASGKSAAFIYGKGFAEACNAVRKLAQRGLYTIVNETVDIGDGGVSGVALGNVIEFAPGDTPRCVEQPGVVSLERKVGIDLLKIVYGFTPSLDFAQDYRVEFSIHPIRRGVCHEHTIVWELEQVKVGEPSPSWIWPNRFSRFIGDKVYGLLIAHILGFPVPRTTVVCRRVPPFTFGRPTGTGEIWIRTSPGERQPGRFTTQSHWCDPFELMHQEDPSGIEIPSVLVQEGVEAQEGVEDTFSGALNASQTGEPIIEGVRGKGDEFMVGKKPPEHLPTDVVNSVKSIYHRIEDHLGSIEKMEWVYDRCQVWVVQLHRGMTMNSVPGVIVPGEAQYYHRFEIRNGIAALRELVNDLRSKSVNHGIVLIGDVGITSHFGDILRRSGIPSRIEYSHASQYPVPQSQLVS